MNRDRYFIPALGLGQIVSWGTLYYSFPPIAEVMGHDLGLTKAAVYGAATIGLLASSFVAYPTGVWIDRGYGRLVMTVGSFFAALLLLAWSVVTRGWMLYPLFTLIGIVQGMTLYDAAFAVIAKQFRNGLSRGITNLTLWGGFASTVFVPLIQLLLDLLGWRSTLMVLAAIHFAIGFLHHAIIQENNGPEISREENSKNERMIGRSAISWAARQKVFWGLLATFVIYYATFSGLAYHLYPLLAERRFKPSAIAGMIALLGPAQVAGRILIWSIQSRISTKAIGRLVVLSLPLGLFALLYLAPLSGSVAFIILFGISNGIMTVIRGTAVPEMLTREAYGSINSAIAFPGTLAKAISPFVVAMFWGLSASYDAAIALVLFSSILVIAGFWYASGCESTLAEPFTLQESRSAPAVTMLRAES